MCLFFIIVLISIRELSCYEKIPQRGSSNEGECNYFLQVSDDGPVVLDVPITIDAVLSCAPEDEEYLYVFKDDAVPPHVLEVKNNMSASATFLYSEDQHLARLYVVTVSTYLKLRKTSYLKVATKRHLINVTEHISGNLILEGIQRREQDLQSNLVGTNQTMNMTLDILYPERFYPDAEFTYSWTINKQQFVTTAHFRSHTFSDVGTYEIHVSAVARIPVYSENQMSVAATRMTKYKWGTFRDSVTVKNPFFAINLTGNTYLQHGQLLNLDVFCNGSGPIEYCWKVLLPTESETNVTCSAPVSTNQCSFPVIYYFHKSGDYVVFLFVDNFVSDFKRNVEVHIYDVSLRPQLSTVLVPLTCVILAIIIIAVGVVFHFRRRERYDVETADFDFLQSETFSVETFWEQMYRSLLHCFHLGTRRSTFYLKDRGYGTLDASSHVNDQINEGDQH